MEANPRIDTSNVTVAAFNSIKDEEKKTKTKLKLLGRDDTTYYKSPNFKVKVRAYTRVDKQYHTYFHSLSIDVNVDDFMGTAELKCPYDSDLMEYWTPITQDVVIYGANRGPEKILFIGRVRGVKQDGYEMVIEFQNYAWKFKQLVTQSYANDNVLNKDGYTIMRLMFQALKIDSWVISPAAKKRLKEVGINQDGNLTVNGAEVKEIPDLIERLKKSDPSDSITKDTLNNKLREKYLHNIKDINYTLKYEKPTPVMKKIASQGSYSGGDNIYANPYGSVGGAVGDAVGQMAGGALGNLGNALSQQGSNCYTLNVRQNCPAVASSSMQHCMQVISSYNRGCRNDIEDCESRIMEYASGGYAKTGYRAQVSSCLGTICQNITRQTGRNSCSRIKSDADAKAAVHGNLPTGVNKTINWAYKKGKKWKLW